MSWFQDPRGRAAIIAAWLIAAAVLHWAVPLSQVHLHGFLQHLNFIPIVAAGLLFGSRGAIASTALAVAVQTPHLLHAWSLQPVYAMDQVLEWPVFCLAGAVTGFLSEKERGQRTKLEKTKRELEDVYHELQQNFERLKKAERLYAAGQLSAGLAHEIRNPLASISGAAGILKRRHASSEDVQECLEIIDRESQRLNKLLTSFLDFARPRVPRFRKTDLSGVLESVASLAGHAPGAGSINLACEAAGALPEIDCDPEQIKQVLLNLLINAIQATPGNGTVRLTASARNGHVSIAVRDEGCGIPEAERDRVFDPFYTTKENGTGLGLAVASKIVEQHGGSIHAESNEDKGMTFVVELPVEREASR